MKLNQIKVGAALSYMSLFLNSAIGFLVIPLIIRYLSRAEYGVYMLMGSLISYISLVDFGFGNAMERYIAKARAEKDKKGESNMVSMFLIIMTSLAIIGVIIGSGLYFYIDKIFPQLTPSELDKAKTMYIFMIFNFAITMPLGVFNAVMNGYERFIFSKASTIVRILVRTALVVLVLTLGYKAVAIVMVDTLVNVLIGLSNYLYTRFKLNVVPKLYKFDYSFIGESVKYTFFVFLAMIADEVNWRTGNVVLGIFKGAESVAVYSIAVQLLMMYMNIASAINGMFIPKVIFMIKDNQPMEALNDIFVKIGRLQWLLLGFLFSAFILFGYNFIYLWAGEGFTGAYIPAIIIFVPLTLALIQNFGIQILYAKNKHAFRSYAVVASSVLNVVLTVVLVQKIGALGAAIGLSISFLLGNVLAVGLYLHKTIGLDLPGFIKKVLGNTMPAFIIAISAGALTLLIKGSSWELLILRGAIFTIAYTLSMWFIGTTKYERELLTKPLKLILKLNKQNGSL